MSNNGFIDGISFDGLRKCLYRDFTRIYHLDLSGNARTSGEQRRREGGNVFDDKIRVSVGITVAVRHSGHKDTRVFYHRVPDYSEKVYKLAYLVKNVELEGRHNSLNTVHWQELTPDIKGYWLTPENTDEFSGFLPLGTKETKTAKQKDVKTIFKVFSNGVKTNRDDAVYSFTRQTLIRQIDEFIENYNGEVDRFKRTGGTVNVDDFVKYEKLKWSRDLKLDLQRGRYAEFDEIKVRTALYRPFCKSNLFFDRILNEEVYVFPRIFPNTYTEQENVVIALTDIGSEWQLASLVANCITDLHFVGVGANSTKCFPYYVYDEDGGNRRENITDWALQQFRTHYQDESISKWDIFYYVYGMLHHPGYRERYADNLKRELPRIPFVPSPQLEGEIPTPHPSPMHWGGAGGGEDSTQPAGGEAREDTQSQGWAHTRATSPELWEKIKPLARQMRKAPTPAEDALWQRLRRHGALGYKFRRQHPIDRFIVDFYCASARLVVEVDGAIHDYTQEQDVLRQEFLESLGLRVLRFSNGDVMHHLDAVMERIGEVLQEEVPSPSQWGGEDSTQQAEEHGEGKSAGFWAFAEAGRRLAELHLNYETVEPYPLEFRWTPGKPVSWRVEKMRLVKQEIPSPTPPQRIGEGLGVGKTTMWSLKVNDSLTLAGIPPEAFEYRLGNRSALEWVIDQYQVKTDSRSGITSDPNGYSEDEQYIVRLVGQVIAVSVETVHIVNGLAELPFREEDG